MNCSSREEPEYNPIALNYFFGKLSPLFFYGTIPSFMKEIFSFCMIFRVETHPNNTEEKMSAAQQSLTSGKN